MANPQSIQVNAVEDFPPATVIPPVVMATGTSSDTTTDLSVTTGGELSDIYFEVDVNVTLTGFCIHPELTIITWLHVTLPDEMSVLTFQLLGKAYSVQHPSPRSNTVDSDGPSLLKTSRHGCRFQMRVTTSSSQEETRTRIRTLLEKTYTNGTITMENKSNDINIRHIPPGSCLEHRHQTRQGLFVWPGTWAPRTATLPCQGDTSKTASRLCLLGLPIHWGIPDLHQCPFVVETIPDLDNIDVTPENAMDVVEMIESLLKDHPDLNCTELNTVLKKLKNIVFISCMTPPLGKAIINIISDMLESKSYLQHVTNQILNITEMVGDKMSYFDQTNYTLVASAMAISVVDVDRDQFQVLTFGVSSAAEGLNPEIYINKDPFKGTVAFISLPSALKYRFPQHSGTQPRVQFQFYGVPTLFMNNPDGKILNTYVVSASVTNASGPIKDLEEDVEVTLHHVMSNPLGKEVQCVYWDFNQNEGKGGWEPHGCRKHNTSADYTTCLCDHLTHFGVLLDVSRTQIDIANEEILTIITYLGCGVSSLFLGITVLTYTAFEKLRRDYPSKILMNLSLALLGLNMVFLVNSWLSSFGSYGLCVAVASTLHYFLLASFTWMGLEAVHMYFALVKVFNVYVPSYILKFCSLGWGIPLAICCVVLVVKRESYGSSLGSESMEPLDNSEAFCWIQDEVVFYVSVVGYILLVMLCNMAIFVVVLVQIRHMRVNQPAGIHSGLLLQDLKGVSSLTFLLGLTWTVAFFAWGPAKVPFLYLFCVLNSLQGFFIFLFHCLMKENVRKQWRIHLCFGRFRLQDYSEWSQTFTVGAKSRPNPLVRMPSVRSIKSSATESTSASSDSSQRQVSIRRPNLDLVYENNLALPLVQRNFTPLPHKSASFPEEGNCEGPSWQDGSHPRHRLPIP
ncbi:adhesion G-protein coupled receptor G4 [Salmo trutta]|uniref:adhesion G-protein coupled receptor G4 n=1 Tax=Salmo trutta TaxID=8032 RepID=UPI00112FDAE0|nr:adhesion G-protein coupled receptor G4-like [Salmo trutta]